MASVSPICAKLANYGNQGKKTPIRGEEIGELLKDYDSLVDLLPNHASPAICEPSNGEKVPLTHARLKQFVRDEFDLRAFGVQHGQRVAVLLPNGPELALTIISVVSHWCAAPINPTNTWQEIKMELISTKAVAVMVLAGASVNTAALRAAEDLGVGVIAITPTGKPIPVLCASCF